MLYLRLLTCTTIRFLLLFNCIN